MVAFPSETIRINAEETIIQRGLVRLSVPANKSVPNLEFAKPELFQQIFFIVVSYVDVQFFPRVRDTDIRRG